MLGVIYDQLESGFQDQIVWLWVTYSRSNSAAVTQIPHIAPLLRLNSLASSSAHFRGHDKLRDAYQLFNEQRLILHISFLTRFEYLISMVLFLRFRQFSSFQIGDKDFFLGIDIFIEKKRH